MYIKKGEVLNETQKVVKYHNYTIKGTNEAKLILREESETKLILFLNSLNAKVAII